MWGGCGSTEVFGDEFVYVSESNVVFVRFRTDSGVTARGVSFEYSSVESG